MTQKAEQFWDKQASRYDESEKQFSGVYEDVLAKTGKYLTITDQVLDFGCATGTKTLGLARKVNHIRGLDISPGMINEALRKMDELKISNVSFSPGTIFSSDLEKESFDTIISYAVIHLLEDKEKVLRRIHELLKPGGLFISTVPLMKENMTVKNRIEVTLYRFLKKLGVFPLHLNLFTLADVETLLKDCHFEMVESEKFFSGLTAGFMVARKSESR